jgi:hypothetical protein
MDPNSIQLLSDLLNDPEKEEDDIEFLSAVAAIDI